MAQPVASPGPQDAQGRPTAPDDRRWLVLVVIAVAQLMVVLDATVINIALPSAQHALGFSNNDRQWVVTCYALAFGSLLLVGGRIGDMFSRKWVFITGLAGFAVASAIGGASVSFAMLVTARTLQGVFGRGYNAELVAVRIRQDVPCQAVLADRTPVSTAAPKPVTRRASAVRSRVRKSR